MASRVSQMRNGLQPYPQTQQAQQQQALNDSIARTRAMMQTIQTASNKEAALAQLLQNNPNIASVANLLKNGTNLEQVARQMASANGIDINQLITNLL